MNVQPGDLILLEWSYVGETAVYHTVGWLVREDMKALYLSPHKIDGDPTPSQTEYPLSYVKGVTKLG